MIFQDRQIRSRLDRVIDAIATRIGIVLMLGLTGLVCTAAGLHISSAVQQLEADHAVFRDRQIRNGYVAMSDVQRLILISQSAFAKQQMTPELAADFTHATDIIFVRIDNFGRMIGQDDALQSGINAIAALEEILRISDTAITREFPDVQMLFDDLLAASNTAREHLVKFLDDMRRQADQVLDNQSAAVRTQKYVVLATLAGLTVLVTFSLLLLSREVVGRRARDAAEKKVAYLAYFDPLTGLPNRTQFQTKLQNVIDTKAPVTLLIADLDGFKLINDTYGHAAGDALLKSVGTRLNDLATQVGGFVARLGGDEFVIMIPTEDISQIAPFCMRVINLASDRFDYEGEALIFGFSVGLATAKQASSNGELTIDTFSKVTDFALYEAKQNGKSQYCIYDTEIEQKFKDRKAMVEDLPKAIHDQQLEVYLQPKVSLPDAYTLGFEALVRWRRNKQLIPPCDFIMVAEESGLVLEIDRHVLQVAAKTLTAWNAKHKQSLSVSVNLSTLHFNSNRIVGFVAQVLVETGMPPHLLTLEITETTEMRDWKTAQPVLEGLKALGVKISIDDFGTGYSSLAYLQATMADELKVDRSLVQKIENSRKACLLLSSVLDIARNLELDVVVEGVETEGQAKLLCDMGVTCVQGFLFGRPAPSQDALISGSSGAGPVRCAS